MSVANDQTGDGASAALTKQAKAAGASSGSGGAGKREGLRRAGEIGQIPGPS